MATRSGVLIVVVREKKQRPLAVHRRRNHSNKNSLFTSQPDLPALRRALQRDGAGARQEECVRRENGFSLASFFPCLSKRPLKLTSFSLPRLEKKKKKNVFSSGAAQQAELSKTASSFAETFKQEVKKGLDEVAKQQQPPKGGGGGGL
jgi:hypothetical protein